MKKLIAILVVFALVAGAAFAETAIGGSAEVRWTIAQNSGADGADTLTSAGIEAFAFQLSNSNDEGTFGGMGKVVFGGMSVNRGLTSNGTNPGVTIPDHGHTGGADAGGGTYPVSGIGRYDRSWETAPVWVKWDRAFAWWQPIPQVKFFLGQDGDGQFNTANLSRWGHHQMDRGISVEDWDAGKYLMGNWDAFGAALIITPMDGLAINFAMNLPWSGSRKYDDMFEDSIQLQVSYAIPDIGNVYVTYNNFGGGDGNFGLTFFNGSFVDGLAFEVGFAVDLDKDDDNIYIGIGAHYNGDGWGVKTRFFMEPNEAFFYLKADIMPFVSFDFGTLYCNIRIRTISDEDLSWHVNPYLRMNVGVGDFRVGALIEGSTVSNSDVSLKIATSMLVSF